MKMELLRRMTMVGVILLMGALSGRAQSRTDELAVHVPFEFNVGQKTLPAGDYIISRDFNIQNRLIIRRADRSVVAIVQTARLTTSPQEMKTVLNFQGYQGQYYLKRVQTLSGEFSDELIKTNGERQLARMAATRSL